MFQPERLVFARKRRQLTQTDLARAVDVTPRTIQRYESAEKIPPQEGLARIAAALEFPLEFFSESRPLPDIPPPALSFRAYSKISAKLRDNAIAAAQIAVGINDFLEQHFELPEVTVPDLQEYAASPNDAAKLLREEWALGSGPIANMVHLLEKHGVRVFSLSEDAADVDAFCFWQHVPFVVLNMKKSGERGRFDAAHELAHLTLHRAIDFQSKDVERAANEFASEFLVPKLSLIAQLPSMITLKTVMKLKAFWKISALAMVKRLRDVERISEWVYRTMCMQLSADGFRKGEPGGIEREESNLFVDMFGLEEGVQLGEVARALRVRPCDISPLVFRVPERRRGHLRAVWCEAGGWHKT